jgi:hypothetical protein
LQRLDILLGNEAKAGGKMTNILPTHHVRSGAKS